MSNRRVPGMVGALLCCGALLLTGCGSDPSESSSAASSATADANSSPAAEVVTPDQEEDAPAAESDAPADEMTDAEMAALGDVEVNQGLLSVTITLPKEFAEDVTQADIDKAIADGDIQDGRLNDDGTVSYRLSKSQHEESLAELRGSVDEVIAEENSTNPGLYEEVTYNDDMTQFRVVVADRKKYEQSMSMMGLGLLFGAAFYQIFYGVPEDERNVVIEYVDGKTGEVFDTYDSRDEREQ